MLVYQNYKLNPSVNGAWDLSKRLCFALQEWANKNIPETFS